MTVEEIVYGEQREQKEVIKMSHVITGVQNWPASGFAPAASSLIIFKMAHGW